VYLLALIFPPAAVAMCGKPFQAILACFLMIFFWFPGVIYAWIVVADFKANDRNERLVHAIGGRRRRRYRDD
jgi:uncharacterized membrane protein YqaE (UPF0057 family)